MASSGGPGSSKRSGSIDELGNVFDDAKTYYTEERHVNKKAGARTRTFSQNGLLAQMERLGLKEPFRRGSHGTHDHSLFYDHDFQCHANRSIAQTNPP